MNKMEYSLLKQLEPNIGHLFPNSTHPQLSAYPALDYVNPGIGQLARIHNFIVPLHAQDNLHLIEKQITEQSNIKDLAESLNEQIGSGIESETKLKSEEQIIEEQKSTDPETLNAKKRHLMGESIYSSFMHPKKLKVTEINLDAKTQQKKEKIGNGLLQKSTPSHSKIKNVKHKFSFCD